MTQPGIKYRSDNRWVVPQLHETLFRAGAGAFTGAAVVSGSGQSFTDTLTNSIQFEYQTPASALSTPILVVGVSALNTLMLGAAPSSVAWNGHNLTQAISVAHATNGGTSSIWYWVNPELNTNATLTVTFPMNIGIANVAGVTLERAASVTPIDATGSGQSTNSTTNTASVTTTVARDLILDCLTHYYAAGSPAPVVTETGQAIVPGSAFNGSALSAGLSTRPATPIGAISMSWGSLGAMGVAVQTAVAVTPYSVPTQPVTAKLALGYDFSGTESVITITGSGISNVTDSSGNGNDGTQGTDARRLLYGTATINGSLAAENGATVARHVILPASITNWTNNGQPPAHVLCVFRAVTWTNGATLWSFQNGGGALRFSLRMSTSGGTRLEMRTPTAGPGATVTLSTETALATATTYLAEVAIDGGGNASLIVNEGTAATTTAASSGESLTTRRVYDLTAAADALMGGIYIFNDALTAPELAQWRTFLKSRWGYV